MTTTSTTRTASLRTAFCLAGATAAILLSAPLAAAGDQEYTGSNDRGTAVMPSGDVRTRTERVFIDDDALEVAQVALGMLAGTALVGAAVATRQFSHRHHVQSA